MQSRAAITGLLLSALIVGASASGANFIFAKIQENTIATAAMAEVDRGADTDDVVAHQK